MITRSSQSRGEGSPTVVGFHDAATGSCQYLLIDPATRAAALIDIVLDFDPVNCRTSPPSAERALALLREHEADLKVVIDTHPHAERRARDATLPLPRLMLHALQFNLRGGRLVPDAAGDTFFKLPANRF